MTLILSYFVVSSVNQPDICPFASWNLDAVIFEDNSTVNSSHIAMFIDINDTVYVTAQADDQIHLWFKENMTVTHMISVELSSPRSIFVTATGNIYIDNGQQLGRVDMWSNKATRSVTAMAVAAACYGLFVDINNNVYCSQLSTNLVVRKAAVDDANTSSIAAGNGSCGSASNMLCAPIGIFVDITLNMYIADSGNGRVQLFKAGELFGTTVSSGLNNPTDVVLDANGCLFITDSNNHRIIRSGSCGFLCLIGCVNADGGIPNALFSPFTLAFDSRGRIFVVDESNRRIQKYSLDNRACGELTDHLFDKLSTIQREACLAHSRCLLM